MNKNNHMLAINIQYLLYVAFDVNFLDNIRIYKTYKVLNDQTFKSNNSLKLIEKTESFLNKDKLINYDIFNYNFINFYILDKCNGYYYFPTNTSTDTLYYEILNNLLRIENLSHIYNNFKNLDLYKDTFKFYNITLIIKSFDIALIEILKPYLIDEMQSVKTILENESNRMLDTDIGFIKSILEMKS